ncbi:MAG: transglycosylase SLT domain-containing protein [Anaerolineae bacterium]|jgi:hypothetical protein|nr:transglycosylase SLT domain-containing protein [Anaerolineae bacterium]MBT7074556.1 transglycosylase SLT domain-containing protein [Anaerolineae bacterium]MBT7782070.1 transglycosylase SLT domain-containing protein [Anaerolineae bacterium]
MYDDDYYEEYDDYEEELVEEAEYDYPEDEYWEEVEGFASDDYDDELASASSPRSLLPPLLAFVVGIFLIILLGGIKEPADVEGKVSSENSLYASHPGISPLFTPEVHFWGDKIMVWASETGLDPNIIATIMQIESCGDPHATSGAGAMGLFQVMPYHFESDENPYFPDTNALRGLGYLNQSLNTASGNARLAFAGYNGGISVISKAESAWANETQRYAYWGSGIYADALQGATQSARLDEWLAHGGSSLCAQARGNQ